MTRILKDGYSTIIGFAENPTIYLNMKEKTVKPPGYDGGDEIDTTTMRNETVRTFAPRSLLTLTESTFTAAYDPDVMPELEAMINVNQLITVTYPDLSTLAFWGYLKTAEPSDHEEGSQPTLECSIIPTNEDENGDEILPVETPGA